MLKLPPEFASIILAFAQLFRRTSTWNHALVLLLGAFPAQGKETFAGFRPLLAFQSARTGPGGSVSQIAAYGQVTAGRISDLRR